MISFMLSLSHVAVTDIYRARLHAAAFERGRIPLCLLHDDAAPSVRGSNSSGRATDEPLSQQTQNLRGGARRGAASLRLGMGIKPSRWASFLAALRARRIASAFSRVLRSDGFSYALRRFISRKMPSRCSFFLRALRA
jgi:hypothetical protein